MTNILHNKEITNILNNKELTKTIKQSLSPQKSLMS